jgi:hypothetical protein
VNGNLSRQNQPEFFPKIIKPDDEPTFQVTLIQSRNDIAFPYLYIERKKKGNIFDLPFISATFAPG